MSGPDPDWTTRSGGRSRPTRSRPPLPTPRRIGEQRLSRREFLSLSLLASGGVILSPLLAACATTGADGTLGRARSQGFIRVGFANEAPYGHLDETGQLTGAAPEVAREVMRKLGVPQLDGITTPFGSLISGLQQGRFDLIAAGMFITPERCQEILFSDPDYCVQQAFLVAEGNPHAILRYEDIAAQPRLRLGVLTGAVEATQATESGIPPGHVRRFDNPADILSALQTGRIHAAALTTISLANLAAQTNFEGVEVTEGFTHQGQPGCGAFGFRQDDIAFRDQFNQVLTEMKQQGDITRIVEPFGFAEAAQAADDHTAEEHCTQ
ncbi:MAG: ectoine/hydroxyectoine ABC transporter substrate-binding protein EhuB [Acidimicrobiia bacterium]